MNKLTAIRCFANSGYCPVKHTRIYANKWYLVELQDIERDFPTDYIGLAETSTVYLLDGIKAKRERDSRLNHCNRIMEYTGNVFMLQSDKMCITEYYPDLQSANAAKSKHDIKINNNLVKALQSLDQQSAMTNNEILAMYGKCKDWPGNEIVQIAEFRNSLELSRKRNIEYWLSDITIKQVK